MGGGRAQNPSLRIISAAHRDHGILPYCQMGCEGRTTENKCFAVGLVEGGRERESKSAPALENPSLPALIPQPANRNPREWRPPHGGVPFAVPGTSQLASVKCPMISPSPSFCRARCHTVLTRNYVLGRMFLVFHWNLSENEENAWHS